MSRLEGGDPIPGDPQSCDALDMVIVPRARDIGGFEVRRALPHARRQLVGPFIFFDQMGPARFEAGHGLDVRPHPHIGLSTVTYLFEGAIMHRDSLGNRIEIAPGSMNLMTAGRGIAHSERSPDAMRASGQIMSGIQTWIALPEGREEIDPDFQHFSDAVLPLVQDTGLTARIIAGKAFGKTAPVATQSDWFYVDLALAAGATAPLDPDYEERAVYVAEGEIEIAGARFPAGQLLIFRPGDRITLRATQTARVMLLGGAALGGPRHIWWNFVSSSRERIEQAKDDWKRGRFEAVPDETEFIPLPD